MHFLNSILLIPLILSSATANVTYVEKEPINCRGSFLCGNDYNNITDVQALLKDIELDRVYQNHEYIACLMMPKRTWQPGKKCVFPQYTKHGVNGSQVLKLVQALVDEQCLDCGSVQIDYPNKDKYTDGILTINYVTDLHDHCKNQLCYPKRKHKIGRRYEEEP